MENSLVRRACGSAVLACASTPQYNCIAIMEPSRKQLSQPGSAPIMAIIGAILAGVISLPLGAIAGVALGVNLGCPDWLIVIFVIAGALLVGSFAAGVTAVVVTFARWRAMLEDQRQAEPPRKVVLTGALLGSAEGTLVGAFHGGLPGALSGAILGMGFGTAIANWTWMIRSNVHIYIMALFLGALVELAGGIGIALVVPRIPNNPLFTGLSVFCLVTLAVRCMMWLRNTKATS
jgi:hypothetical protein